MKRVMIDIETLSTKQDAIIAQVGIVVSEPGKEDFSLLIKLDWLEQEAYGRVTDVNTLLWWMQADRAQTFVEMGSSQADCLGIEKAVDVIEHYLRGADEVWANSPTFDIACINSLIGTFGSEKISYKIERDFRTARALHPTVVYEYPVDAHNALADAQAQVAHLRKLGIWPENNGTEVANG